MNEADDTTWKNLGSKGEGDPNKFYLWAVLNDKAACFNVYNARNQKVAKNFLGKLEGFLVTDGHSSFKALGGANSKLILANDWCHARRRFKEARKNYGPEAKTFLDAMKTLFSIEDEIRDKPPDQRHQLRQEKSKPVVERIRELLDQTVCLPESSLGRAITYTDKLWEGLTVFLSDPRVPIHTNNVERALRSPAIGRKNHLGSKNLATASVAAIWYSVITTCKLNGVDPREYITATIRNILSKKPYLMPWEWAASKS